MSRCKQGESVGGMAYAFENGRGKCPKGETSGGDVRLPFVHRVVSRIIILWSVSQIMEMHHTVQAECFATD